MPELTIASWLALAGRELDLDLTLDDTQIHLLLDLARDAAHQIDRPAAPLTTFLVGVAVGRGATLEAASAVVTALALDAEAGSAGAG
ncbi:MAG: DUF6457 domain-containing protein [Propionibacteriaceae bacterium]